MSGRADIKVLTNERDLRLEPPIIRSWRGNIFTCVPVTKVEELRTKIAIDMLDTLREKEY